MIRRALPLLLLASCGYSLRDDMEDLHAEIEADERSIPPEAPLWISEGPNAFDRFVRDASDRVPEFIYRHLVRKLHALPSEEIDARVEGTLDPGKADGDPDLYRGKFWRVSGVIGHLRARPVRGKDFPVPLTHEGVLFFDGRMSPVLFHVVEKPEVLTLREDWVETHALFVKIIEYTTESGRVVRAPFFIGKVLRRLL